MLNASGYMRCQTSSKLLTGHSTQSLSPLFSFKLLLKGLRGQTRLIFLMCIELTETSFLTALGVLIVTTNVVAGTHLVFGIQNGLRNGFRMRWDNAWLITAYVFFMMTSGAQAANPWLLFRYLDGYYGRIPRYVAWENDGLRVTKLLFIETLGLWLTLWSVKFSLLSLYKSLMAQVPLYTRLWWAVLIYCICVSRIFQTDSFPRRCC